MSSENSGSDERGTDPRTLRALAHPVRLDLLRLLDQEGELTATRAAELLELTPKVCSYHLQLLGRYGVVEEAGGGVGRARPWRAAIGGLNYVHHPDEGEQTARAADAFATAMAGRDARTVEDFVRHRGELPGEWRNISTMSSNALRLTPDQLREFSGELAAVLHRYQELSRSPAPAARPVQAMLYAVPTRPFAPQTGADTAADDGDGDAG